MDKVGASTTVPVQAQAQTERRELAKIRESAREFEAIFLETMLKTMK